MESVQISQNLQISKGMAIVLGSVFGALLLVIGLEFYVAHVSDEVDGLKQALSNVQEARGKLRLAQTRKETIARRYATKAPPLAGFIEQTAHKQGIDVSDSVDRQEVPIGKKYVERATTVHLKKSGMYSIGKFLENVEKTSYPIAVSKLNIRKRSGEGDSYDVEVSVSAYDHVETPEASKDAAKGTSAEPSKDSGKKEKP